MRIKANEAAEEIAPVVEDDPVVFEDDAVPEPDFQMEEQPKKRFETSKLIVWVCLINGFLWVWCSYLLAWLGKEQIAESLSQVALTEIIGVVLVHCVKTVVENLSKNNKWPDKPGGDEPSGGLG